MGLLQQNPSTLVSDSFFAHLQGVARDVEATLDGILSPPTTRLFEAMRYSVLGGGKYLRSFLVVASSRLYGVPYQQTLQTAAALELIQSYSLVHDDLPCMDNAALRRGKPSCHKAFGEAVATLVGDALIPLAFQTLARLDVSADVRAHLTLGLAQVIGPAGLVAGQMMDLGLEGPRESVEDLREQQRLKTGVFFGFATACGAILGGADSREREALKTYGLFFGEAFQMIDDLLDGCGQEETLGKSCGQDAEKQSFFNLLGPERLYEQATIATQNAIHAVSVFGERGSLLKAAALHLLDRKR